MSIRSLTALCATLLVAQACSLGAQEARKEPARNRQGHDRRREHSIEYGRPYMKGRKVEGGLIPYDDIWRAGADEATTLTSDKALVIGGTNGAGREATLYVAATAGEWKRDRRQTASGARITTKADSPASR